ncbi:MAG: dihydroneopterin aldolase [Acidobacteriota bacterium]
MKSRRGPADMVLLEGVRIRPRVGTTARERSRRPRCTLSIEIQRDLRRAQISDRIEDTIDYQHVFDLVQAVAGRSEHRLLESLGGAIASEILRLGGVRAVVLTLRKVKGAGLDSFGIRIARTRSGD